jgi:hypothetical protein
MSPQKLLFYYHLPTRGRAGVKLGDADTSQMKIKEMKDKRKNTTILCYPFFILQILSRDHTPEIRAT